MSKRSQLINRRFGKLKVIQFLGVSRYPSGTQSQWGCKCDCGKETIASTSSLKGGHKRSCGCLKYQSGNKSKLWGGCGEISGNQYCVIRNCAESRMLKFEVDIKYLWKLFLKQKRRCALSGVLLTFNYGGRKKGVDGTASLDRINSSNGYIKGNVQWVHKDINRIKSDLDQRYFVELCESVFRFMKEK